MRNVYDAISGEWLEVEDANPPLPEHDPYWAYAQIGLVVICWGCGIAALWWAL